MTGQPTEVVDLVAALRASVEAAKQRREAQGAKQAKQPRACTRVGCTCRLLAVHCYTNGDWQCECRHPKAEHHQGQPQVRKLDCTCTRERRDGWCPRHGGYTCDWESDCDSKAVAERLAGESAGEEFDGFSAWLPVCAEHAKSVA